MNRPTIADLAQASGVSVSTINRVLHGTGSVRQETIDRILEVADDIGFYGLGTIRERKKATLPHFRIGVLLQQSHRQWYRMIEEAISTAATRRDDVVVEANTLFEDDLTPEAIADNLLKLGRQNDAVSVIASDHPVIGQAIETLRSEGIPTVAYITDQSSPHRAGYVGTDNWKLGRTAAWFISQTAHKPGRIVTLIGNHRYQCQDISDASFRSYMREHAPAMTVSDAIPTQEEPENAYNIVRELVAKDPDLVGIYVGGGGISGVLRAIRELDSVRRSSIRVVCRDMGNETRKGLSEGLITAALCHPLDRISTELIDVMLDIVSDRKEHSIVQRVVPFEVVTPESVWA